MDEMNYSKKDCQRPWHIEICLISLLSKIKITSSEPILAVLQCKGKINLSPFLKKQSSLKFTYVWKKGDTNRECFVQSRPFTKTLSKNYVKWQNKEFFKKSVIVKSYVWMK